MSISSGLLAAYNKQESGTSWLDLTGNGNDVPLTNTTWEADGLQANANGEYGLIDNTGQGVVNSEEGTIIIKTKSLSAFNDNANRVLFGSRVDGNTLGDLFIMKFSSNQLFLLLYDNAVPAQGAGNHYVSIGTAKVPNWLTGTQIAGLWKRSEAIFNSDNIVLNVDGAHVVPDASANETSWDSYSVVTSLGVLNNSDDTTMYANSIFEYMYIFNTVKTEAELTAIAANHSIILADYFYTTGVNGTTGCDVGIGI